MLSLNNAFDDDEVHDFEKRVRERLRIQEIEYVAEPKREGLAVSFIYNDLIINQLKKPVLVHSSWWPTNILF